jgi:predicted SnoaL-like aldol condensation-catalyzing enzyme
MHVKRTWFLSAAAAALAVAACTTATMDAGMMASLAPPHAPIIEGKPVEVVAHPDQLTLLGSDDPQLATNKQFVFDMWRNFLVANHTESAETYLAESYMQHNPMAATGRAAVMAFFASRPRMEDVPATIPGLVTILAEDDKVVLALRREYDDPTAPGETYTTTWFDMFRLEDGVIAEHWDIQTLPPGFPAPTGPTGPIPVTGATTAPEQIAMLASDDPQLAANKRLVFDMWRGLVDASQEGLAPQWLDEGYIQHNPNAATGRAGVQAYFATRPDTEIQDHTVWPLVDVVAEGDLVALAFVRELPKPDAPDETYTTTWFDLFRIENGVIMEHWDIAQKGAPPPAR